MCNLGKVTSVNEQLKGRLLSHANETHNMMYFHLHQKLMISFCLHLIGKNLQVLQQKKSKYKSIAKK